MKALILYWSATGNTEKIADAIYNTLIEEKVNVERKKIAEAGDTDICDYDLVLLGCPSYQFLPPDPVLNYVKGKMKFHSERGDVKLNAPKVPGKSAVVFCTYSGPHTGINEAIPVGKYLGQFFEHIGYDVKDEWYTVGEFHGRNEFSSTGRLGNILGRPNEADITEIKQKVQALVNSL